MSTANHCRFPCQSIAVIVQVSLNCRHLIKTKQNKNKPNTLWCTDKFTGNSLLCMERWHGQENCTLRPESVQFHLQNLGTKLNQEAACLIYTASSKVVLNKTLSMSAFLLIPYELFVTLRPVRHYCSTLKWQNLVKRDWYDYSQICFCADDSSSGKSES